MVEPANEGENPSLADGLRQAWTRGQVETLFDRYHADLLRMVIGVVGSADLAEEVLQTAFARALETGGPDNSNSAKPWLFRVAVNEAIIVRRRLGAEKRAAGHWLDHQRARDLRDDAHPLVRREVIDRVQIALQALPAAEQSVVRARIYDGLRFEEIARRENVPLGTILTRMRRALVRLRQLLPASLE